MGGWEVQGEFGVVDEEKSVVCLKKAMESYEIMICFCFLCLLVDRGRVKNVKLKLVDTLSRS